MEQRQAERGGLPRAGLRAADDITPLQKDWNCAGLNGGGFLKTQFINGFLDIVGKPQFGKLHGGK